MTYFHTCGQASIGMPGGMTHLAHEGLIKRVIGGHWGQSARMMDLIAGNKIEAFNLPQGQMGKITGRHVPGIMIRPIPVRSW